MLNISFNNKQFKISNDILKISTYVSDLIKSKNYDTEPIPLLNASEKIFDLFMTWFNDLTKPKYSTDKPSEFKGEWLVDNIYETRRYRRLNCPAIVYKPYMFKYTNLETLIELFDFALANQIRMLVETVAYAISLRNIGKINAQRPLKILLTQLMNPKLLNHNDEIVKEFIYKGLSVQEFHKVVYEYHPSLFDDRAYYVIYTDNYFAVRFERDYKNVDTLIVSSGLKELESQNLTTSDKHFDEKLENLRLVLNLGFAQCKKIKYVNLPNTITYLPIEYFENCEQLNYINIPESVKVIDDSTFMNCKLLQNIHFPDSLEYIGTAAFKNCFSLTSVELPENVKINSDSFVNCTNVKHVYPVKFEKYFT